MWVIRESYCVRKQIAVRVRVRVRVLIGDELSKKHTFDSDFGKMDNFKDEYSNKHLFVYNNLSAMLDYIMN